ncbi:hypothetical protein TL16_g09958 [Triparma laevis f. inornata]|uniref:Uncharacterized protein n=1 Tax=Triparma laevis f. inornata TaxID=1714386 RepID=A0A9W7BE84_9STRA|nr:hypothetical protein TL16_g09958 [Triparma laevis f. inornata]
MSLFASLGAGGDIWGSSFDFSSPLKDLLETNDFTLTDLLKEDELLQEVKSLNSTLVDYITQPEQLHELLRHLVEANDDGTVQTAGGLDTDDDKKDDDPLSSSVVIVESVEGEEQNLEEDKEGGEDGSPPETPNLDDSEDSDATAKKPSIVIPEEVREKSSPERSSLHILPILTPILTPTPTPHSQTNQAIRYPYLACEVICCDVSQIIDAIVESQDSSSPSPNLLDLIFKIVSKPSPLPPRIAGYFEKVVTALFRRRPTAMSAYINNRGIDLFNLFLNHLGNFSVMQLVKRLIMPKPNAEEEEESWQMGRDDDLDKMTCEWGEDVSYVEKIVMRMKVI